MIPNTESDKHGFKNRIHTGFLLRKIQKDLKSMNLLFYKLGGVKYKLSNSYPTFFWIVTFVFQQQTNFRFLPTHSLLYDRLKIHQIQRGCYKKATNPKYFFNTVFKTETE